MGTDSSAKSISGKGSRLRIFFMFILVLLSTAHFPAQAQQLITVCGASKGKAFYLEPKKEGWVDDGISNGTLTFIRSPDGQHDIISKDAMRSYSVREDGAKVVRTHGDETGRLTLVVAYGDASIVEVYQLTLNASGRGTLIWTNVKQRAGPAKVTRGAVFISECSR